MDYPSISVVIPARNCAGDLAQCLGALAASELAAGEVVVVDDASEDDTADVARRSGAQVIRLMERRGPAFARNRGAAATTGEILLFVDADVCVHPGALERIARRFAEDPELDALFGAYDNAPGAHDFLSQYRNLMHTYVHRNAREEASTFWSGCGAVRRNVFDAHQGFDDSAARPAMEDVELGHRMYLAGRKIRLDRDLRVKHLKRFTLARMIRTDLFERGIPWMELILRDRHLPDDLNVAWSQRISLALAYLVAAALAWGTYRWGSAAAAPLAGLLLFALSRYLSEVARGRVGFSVCGAFAIGLAAASLVQEQTALTAATAIHIAVWAPVTIWIAMTGESRLRPGGRWLGLFTLGAAGAALWELGRGTHAGYAVALLGAMASMVALNLGFYRYLAVRRGLPFAIAVAPFRLLLHLCNGISLVAGTAQFLWRRSAAEKRLPRESEAPGD